jgi:integrase
VDLPLGGASCIPELIEPMSLYRRGRIWWIELSTERGRIRKSAGTADRKEAQEYHEKVKGEIWRQEKLGESAPVTWGEAVAKWMAAKPRGLPDRYRIAAFGIDPNLNLPLETSRVESSLAGGTAGSFNRSLALIVAIHNASGVTPPKIKRQKQAAGRTRWLTKEEWQRLLNALESQPLRDCAEFSIATGVRENNALELRWDQIDLGRAVAWFYADQMKGKVPHGIPLNDDAMAVLRRRRGCHKVYVFPNPDTGKPYYKASNRVWYAALRKSRLKKTGVVWHTLRHTWASWFVMNGGSLQELMQLGGWKSYSMVLRYAHLAPEHLAVAAARVKPVSLRYNAPKGASADTKIPTKGR